MLLCFENIRSVGIPWILNVSFIWTQKVFFENTFGCSVVIYIDALYMHVVILIHSKNILFWMCYSGLPICFLCNISTWIVYCYIIFIHCSQYKLRSCEYSTKEKFPLLNKFLLHQFHNSLQCYEKLRVP